MRLISWFPMVSAILWLVLRLASRKYLDVHAGMNLGVLSNILIILVLVFVSLLSHHRQRQLQGIEVITFLDDFKRTLRYCLTFVLASAVAMLLYYGALSNDIIEIKNASVTAFEGMLRDEAGRAVFMGQHEELTGKSDAELIANFKSQLDSNVTVHSRIIGSVFALLLVSLAYSLLGVVIWRNFMRGGTTRL